MGKYEKKTGKPKGRYAAIYRYMARCDAWRALDCVARCAYLEIKLRWDGEGTNNGRISMSVRELSKLLKVSQATACRAVEALEVGGFIVCTYRGGFTQKTGIRRASEWRLTEVGCDVTGAGATKDFMRWGLQSQESPREIRPNGVYY